MAQRYRVGRHQDRNVYDGDEYIGVMFDPARAATVVDALNAEVVPVLVIGGAVPTGLGLDPAVGHAVYLDRQGAIQFVPFGQAPHPSWALLYRKADSL